MDANQNALSLRMPAEHGAWGVMFAPLVCAAIIANRWNVPLLLCVVCALSLFLLRGSLDRQWQESKELAWGTPAHLSLAAVGAITGGLLIFFYRRYELCGIALAALVLFWVQHELVRSAPRREKRSLTAELVGVVLLSLTAPAAWIAARGSLFAGSSGVTGLAVWLLNLFFFLGGVLYVKYRVRGLLAHREFTTVRERIAFAWPVFLYHLVLLAFLTSGALFGLHRASIIAAFVPGTLRAMGLLVSLGRRFAIPRLGWSEILHSALFLALLVFTMGLAA